MSTARTPCSDPRSDPGDPAAVTGVILAGGRGRRMGGLDKGLLDWRGQPLIAWIIAALAPQVGALLINANRHPDRYDVYGHPVIPDRIAGFQGPLAGLSSAMRAARTGWILTVPCDVPDPPPDLRARLARALVEQSAELAVASDGTRIQPLHLLAPVTLADCLEEALAAGERGAERWLRTRRLALADFGDHAPAFVNLNTPEDLRRLELAT